MKKLLAVLVCGVFMASSTFALGLCVGAKGFLGTDFDNNATPSEQIQSVKTLNGDTNLNFGFGAYTNLTIFAGLGVQAEANLTRGKTSFNAVKDNQKYPQEFEIWTLDIPLMVWLRGSLGPFQLGLGAGPNFAFNLPAGNFKSLYETAKADISNNVFTMGVCVGADAKFFFNKHLGLVIGARYINDFMKTDVPVVVAGYDTGAAYPTVSITRKALYGSVGLEFKFF